MRSQEPLVEEVFEILDEAWDATQELLETVPGRVVSILAPANLSPQGLTKTSPKTPGGDT